jgi:hypothetical protein
MMGEDRNHMTNGWPDTYIRVYDDSNIVLNGSVAPTLKTEYKFGDFSWFRSYKLIRCINGGTWKNRFGVIETITPINGGLKTLKLHLFDYTNAEGITFLSTSDFGPTLAESENIAGGVYGDSAQIGLDGASRTVIIFSTNLNNYVYNVTTGWETSSHFPVMFAPQDNTWTAGSTTANTYAGYYGHNFAAGSDAKSFKYADNHKQADATLWAAYAWRGEASQSFMTTMSPQASIAYRKRARLKVSIPSLPAPIAGVGGTRDPAKDVYGWVYYLGQGGSAPARTAMYQQSNQPTMVANTALTVQNVDLSTYPALTGSNPPAATTFPTAAPATVESDNGLLSITGDGDITARSVTVGGAAVRKSASGSAFMSGPTASVNITFPAGRFSTAPIVTATCTVGGNVALITNIGSITTSGCIAYMYGIGGTWTSGAVSVMWTASEIG